MNNNTLKALQYIFNIPSDKKELLAIYDHCKSFYGKAHVLVYADGSMDLQSYDTIVSHCDPYGHVTHLGKWSRTTNRHQKEFERQFAK